MCRASTSPRVASESPRSALTTRRSARKCGRSRHACVVSRRDLRLASGMARRRLWWGWLLCLALACGAARAQSRGNPVEKLASDAAIAYRGGDYQRAAQLLERAYKMQPVSALLYNLAKAYEKLGDEDKAAQLVG